MTVSRTVAMQASQASHVYTIACPGDFLSLWLAPRLAGFRRDNPQVRFALVGGETPPDFTEANLDLAVRLGEGPGELQGAALGGGERVIVAPRESDGEAPWIAWPGDALPGGEGEEAVLYVADAGLAISAAAAGLGRARVPALLADAALAGGAAIALGARDECRRGYWLVAPTPQWRQKKVKALVGFLTA